ncbi:uncharacterized protein L3040_006876 [Drepanopeziza brunnea f. sp. 'multigermtubi']|uniref:2EXR domain-containing protein n=1 Tax=Marssonina brunnea f. sp. multigermtubi (strain MB_m1) TaxID=1072389 RepID=K1W6T9_MARBU|nr:uncharacterized protein MBM_08954 [Drepanopeziza brunnea f. sp. 'multigermtubi' MB_m1]EKD12725.1 hypothetical protein MBM_08954 [Drepanopeziza brunnea f. sp. 'multigermtubi' MB_m1]KAJ5038002.1 hypothetical protein L3040_006876 [Drepanopeziza brunnea f. sp. 'multigermtubi']
MARPKKKTAPKPKAPAVAKTKKKTAPKPKAPKKVVRGARKTKSPREDVWANRSFTLFPKLPIELRAMIFDLAAMEDSAPKVVRIFHSGKENSDESVVSAGKSRAKAFYKIPAVLHVNNESRTRMLKKNELAFSANLGGAPVYFNYSCDILVFETWVALRCFFTPEDENGARASLPATKMPLDKKIKVVGLMNRAWRSIVMAPSIFVQALGNPDKLLLLRKAYDVHSHDNMTVQYLQTGRLGNYVFSADTEEPYQAPEITLSSMAEMCTTFNVPTVPTWERGKKDGVDRPMVTLS